MNAAETIIAIDPRSRRFGFAAFEGPTRLLDWGIKNFRQGVNAVRIPADVKLAALMDEFLPNAVVVTKRDAETNGMARMREAIFREAEKRHIPVHALPRRDTNAVFANSHRNKYKIAAAVINRLPQLASRRPPKRKTWQSEHSAITIFDAAALGLTYFAHQAQTSERTSIPPRTA